MIYEISEKDDFNPNGFVKYYFDYFNNCTLFQK